MPAPVSLRTRCLGTTRARAAAESRLDAFMHAYCAHDPKMEHEVAFTFNCFTAAEADTFELRAGTGRHSRGASRTGPCA